MLKLAVQHPTRLNASFDSLPPELFGHPAYVAVCRTIGEAGGVASANDRWLQRLSSAAPDDSVRSIVNELAVDPIQVEEGALDRYAREQLGRAREKVLTRQIEELRSRMQRLESEDPAAQAEVFSQVVTLESERRRIHEESFGVD